MGAVITVIMGRNLDIAVDNGRVVSVTPMENAIVIHGTPADGGLTAQEEAFARKFVETRNKTAAYRYAYDATTLDYRKLAKHSKEVIDRPHVQARIWELINDTFAPTRATLGYVVERLLQIVEADPNELIAAKVGACRYCNGANHRYHWRLREYEEALTDAERAQEHENNLAALSNRAPKDVPLPDPGGGLDYDHTAPPHPDCPECKGEGVLRVVPRDTENLSPAGRALYGGVKQTANGLEIKMADKGKALELLGKIIGAFQDDAPKTLQVQVNALTQVHVAETRDPQEAARLYQDMIAGRLS